MGNLDLLADPDRITADPKLAFATAIYFWMTPRENKPSCHDVMVDKWTPSAVDLVGNRCAGYGVTTNIINGGLECNRPGDSRVEDRVKFYERYARILGVSPGPNLYCGDQRPFGLDAAVAKSTAPVSTSVTARVDRKGRTCAELPKRACKKKIGASSTGTARLARAGPGGSWMRRPRSSVWTERAAPARTFDGASATRRSGALLTPAAESARMQQWRPGWPKLQNLYHAWTVRAVPARTTVSVCARSGSGAALTATARPARRRRQAICGDRCNYILCI